MKLEMVFFGSIALVIFYSFIKMELRRARYRRMMMYYPPPILGLSSYASPRRYRRRSSISGVLVMIFLIILAALFLSKVKERYANQEFDNSEISVAKIGVISLPKVAKDDLTTNSSSVTVAPATNTPLVISNLGFGNQIASFSDLDTAKKERLILEKRLGGIGIFIGAATIKGNSYYKLIVGDHPDKSTAKSALTSLKERFPKSFTVDLNGLEFY